MKMFRVSDVQMDMGEGIVLFTMGSKIHAWTTVIRMEDAHLWHMVQSCQTLYVAATLAGQAFGVKRDLPAKDTASMVEHARSHQTPA